MVLVEHVYVDTGRQPLTTQGYSLAARTHVADEHGDVVVEPLRKLVRRPEVRRRHVRRDLEQERVHCFVSLCPLAVSAVLSPQWSYCADDADYAAGQAIGDDWLQDSTPQIAARRPERRARRANPAGCRACRELARTSGPSLPPSVTAMTPVTHRPASLDMTRPWTTARATPTPRAASIG